MKVFDGPPLRMTAFPSTRNVVQILHDLVAEGLVTFLLNTGAFMLLYCSVTLGERT